MDSLLALDFLCLGISTAVTAMLLVSLIRDKVNNSLKRSTLAALAVWLILDMKDIILYLLAPVFSNEAAMEVVSIIDMLGISPCLFICMEALEPGWATKKRIVLHLLPFLVIITLHIILQNSATLILVYAYSGVYTIVWSAYVAIRRRIYRKAMHEQLSYENNVSLDWFDFIFGGFLIFAIIVATNIIHQSLISDCVWYLLNCSFWILITFNVEKYEPSVQIDEKTDSPIVEQQREYEFEKNMDAVFRENKLHLNPKLTREDAALSLGTNRTYLSDYLNRVRGLTFFDYVNGLRVEESEKLLLKGGSQLTEISELSGFGSVSSFLRAFRKVHDCTPREWIEKN